MSWKYSLPVIIKDPFADLWKALDNIFRPSNGKKYIDRRNCGMVLYQKPEKNKNIEQHKNPILNRRLETKRVRTHTKK